MGGGFIPWMISQGTVEVLTRGEQDASILAQQQDDSLASAYSLRKATQVRLVCFLSADEALRNLGTFAFVEIYV